MSRPILIPALAAIMPRSALAYFFWFKDKGDFAIYPAAGASLQYLFPVGDFASWCRRYDVPTCWGDAHGFQVGGGLQYGWVGFEAMVGLGGLPVLSLTGTLTLPVWDGRRKKDTQ